MALTMLLLSQGVLGATFNFSGLSDPNGSTSVQVTSDDGTITATVSTRSPDGLGVSFNQGLGVQNAGGSQQDINLGDTIDIIFAEPVNVEQIGLRLWGEGIGGDSANIISSAGTQFLSGGGDAGNGTVDLFNINLENITEFSVEGLGNIGFASAGGFFLGGLDNVSLAGSITDPLPGPDPEPGPNPEPGPSPDPEPGQSPVPVPAALPLMGFGLAGLGWFGRKRKTA